MSVVCCNILKGRYSV